MQQVMNGIPVRGACSGVCNFCLESICDSNKAWDTHHDSIESLKGSASQQCLFCCTLLDDLHDINLHSLSWPLHRWNLRKLASTRECKHMVLLTFRYINSDVESTAKLQLESLPDRAFHFYDEQGKSTITFVRH